nr:MAG TPA: hypothetical protein [Bacteriophage sp.]
MRSNRTGPWCRYVTQCTKNNPFFKVILFVL